MSSVPEKKIEFVREFTEAESNAIENEFKRLGDNTYLDHAGTTLYADSQIDAASKALKKNLFCNPHTCKMTGDLVDQVRYRILNHFNTDASQYDVVFTANATAALKLVAETFVFDSSCDETWGSFYYCQENHTSVLGMRKIVKTRQQYVLSKDDICANLKTDVSGILQKPDSAMTCNSLIVFSAQCNFSGYKLPLSVIDAIHRNGLQNRGRKMRRSRDSLCEPDHNSDFYVCLDAASYVATSFLDLSVYKPDFVCISFYKMFGYPTGVGALLVSQRGQRALEKSYYGGGTVEIAMSRQDFHKKRDGFHERFEDGTLPFLSAIELLEGFRTVERLIPMTKNRRSIERISNHVYQLAKYCYDKLDALKHANGEKVVQFYNHNGYDSIQSQGGIVTFNIMHDVGTYVGFAEVACMAALHKIQIRTGCFCNAGACQWHMRQTDEDVIRQYNAGHICSDYVDLVDGKPTGAVRASFGYMTRPADVDRLVGMIHDCYVAIKPTDRIQKIETEIGRLPHLLQGVPKRLRAKLKMISVFPIKSCGAFKVNTSWKLCDNGFQYDRNWMIVDGNGLAITQKHIVRLCLIMPKILLDQDVLELQFEHMRSVRVPLNMDADAQHLTKTFRCRSKVCNDLIEGIDCGNNVADWLSDCLETPCLRLIRQCTVRRSVRGVYRDIGLANQAQFLLINITSVRWLSSNLDTERESLQHTIDRFRANLIVQTSAPLEENDFEEISLNGVRFKVDGFCTRCEMICIDQHTGLKSFEPLRTIAKRFDGRIHFGIYLSMIEPVEPETHIECDSELKIKRKAEKQCI